jgi:hypothetical protein
MRQVQGQNAIPGPSNPPLASTSASPAAKPASKASVPPKKGVKGLLKGVVVKKKDAIGKSISTTPPTDPSKPDGNKPTSVPDQNPSSTPPADMKPSAKPPLPIRIGFAAANEAPKRKRIGLADDYGDSSDEESEAGSEAEQKKQKTE